jgi:hypothetical protein
LYSTSEQLEQLPVPAPEVDDPACSRLPEGGEHGTVALGVQVHPLLDHRLLGVVAGGSLVLVGVLQEAPEGRPGQDPLVAEVSVGDEVLFRVRGQPARSPGQKLVHLVAADVVMLVVIQHRDEDVEVRQQVGEPHGCPEADVEVAAVAPLRELFVKEQAVGFDLVAEGGEQPRDHVLAAAASQHGKGGLEGNGGGCRLGTLPTASGHGAAEDVGDGDAEQRRGDVRPVVHVLGKGAALSRRALLPPDQADGVDVQQQSGSAALVGGLGIEDVDLTEVQAEGLQPRRVLVE